MSSDSNPRHSRLSDRELLEIIREFRATDWSAISLASDELEIRIVKRQPGERLRLSGLDETDSSAEHGAALALERCDARVEVKAPRQTPTVVATKSPSSASAATEVDTSGERTSVIRAATIGTFWVAPAPGAEPFVATGARVEAGQQLAIVEVMKLMTEVLAEHAGTIEAVLAENGQTVDAGQPLFRVRQEPAAKGV